MKNQDNYDIHIAKYQQKHGIKPTDDVPLKNGSLKREAGENSAKQSPRKRCRLVVNSSDTESSSSDLEFNGDIERGDRQTSQAPVSLAGKKKVQTGTRTYFMKLFPHL